MGIAETSRNFFERARNILQPGWLQRVGDVQIEGQSVRRNLILDRPDIFANGRIDAILDRYGNWGPEDYTRHITLLNPYEAKVARMQYTALDDEEYAQMVDDATNSLVAFRYSRVGGLAIFGNTNPGRSMQSYVGLYFLPRSAKTLRNDRKAVASGIGIPTDYLRTRRPKEPHMSLFKTYDVLEAREVLAELSEVVPVGASMLTGPAQALPFSFSPKHDFYVSPAASGLGLAA